MRAQSLIFIRKQLKTSKPKTSTLRKTGLRQKNSLRSLRPRRASTWSRRRSTSTSTSLSSSGQWRVFLVFGMATPTIKTIIMLTLVLRMTCDSISCHGVRTVPLPRVGGHLVGLEEMAMNQKQFIRRVCSPIASFNSTGFPTVTRRHWRVS